MIQEIYPLRLDNQYHPFEPGADDAICIFRGKEILIARGEQGVELPNAALFGGGLKSCVYLFSVGGRRFFLADTAVVPIGFAFEEVRSLRGLAPRHNVYACMTAWHLYVWYRDNRFCGRCGAPTVHDGRLRMLSCPACSNMIFPKICPAVIVGVINGDKLLLTKYSGRAYRHYALIAGFTEIGETAEETVAREVMEEVGVRVKNIRYWKSQPWGMESDLLLGYFADVDGDDTITLDADELSVAEWVGRDDMNIPADNVSLTNDMIRAFIENRAPV